MLEAKILRVLNAGGYTPLDIHGLRKQLKLSAHDTPQLHRELERLEREGRIARLKKNRFALPAEADLVPGVLRINRRGVGTLHPDEPGIKLITVPTASTGTAFDGDRVVVRREATMGNRPPAGTVIRILERSRQTIVGTMQKGRQFHYVIPDDPRIPQDIVVPGGKGRVGDKVVVELLEWKSRHLSPEGRVIEVLGRPDRPGVDMLSVIREYGLSEEFPDEVVAEAKGFPRDVRPEECRGRRDCRSDLVVTVDPDDAKDFDDAITVEATKEGWLVRVHVADVSHYVRPGSRIDAEAQKRGNSTYLVDRVIPMLPEALSNELCSLKPAVDRLTKCVEFKLNRDGAVQGATFFSAVIHSRRRFTYREAMAIIEAGKGRDPSDRMILEAHKLAQKIRRRRMAAGSLDLDFPETKIWLDSQGRIDRIERVHNDPSHQLIEELMLLANEAVALRLKSIKRPSLFRVHEPPDPERLEEYREEVKAHGVMCGDLTKRKEIVRLLAKLKEHPAGDALRVGLLRSMKRARYLPDPLGHYGLSKTNYTHFTSPIRRYADLIVHRSLFGKAGERPSSRTLKATSDHISATERKSSDAESDSRMVKMMAHLIEELESRQPKIYGAIVTEVRNFGFFVDVPDLGMGGLVPLSTIENDFYRLDPTGTKLIGKRARRTITGGNKVEVRVVKVDVFKRRVDFTLI